MKTYDIFVLLLDSHLTQNLALLARCDTIYWYYSVQAYLGPPCSLDWLTATTDDTCCCCRMDYCNAVCRHNQTRSQQRTSDRSSKALALIKPPPIGNFSPKSPLVDRRRGYSAGMTRRDSVMNLRPNHKVNAISFRSFAGGRGSRLVAEWSALIKRTVRAEKESRIWHKQCELFFVI